MKKAINYVLIGMIMSLCAWGEEPSLIRVAFEGVRVNYRNVGIYWEEGCEMKGLELNVLLWKENDPGSNVSLKDIPGDRLVLTDSNNKYLGPCEYMKTWGGRGVFMFKKLPSPGARWLSLKGEISVKYGLPEEKTPFVPLKVVTDEATLAGDFKVKVGEIKYPGMEGFDEEVGPSYRVSLELIVTNSKRKEGYSFNGFGNSIELTDETGLPLPCKQSETISLMSTESEKTTFVTYYLEECPEQINIALTYKRKREETIELDLRFDLYPQEEQESQPLGK